MYILHYYQTSRAIYQRDFPNATLPRFRQQHHSLQFPLDKIASLVSKRRKQTPLAVASMSDFNGSIKRRRTLLALTLLNFHIATLALAEVKLARTPDLDTRWIEHLLSPVRQPANAARDGKQNGVKARWRQLV